MTSILAKLRKWAATLPYWEQAALDKIAAGVPFTESVYDELMRYLLEDADLAKSSDPRPELQFPKSDKSEVQPLGGQIRLTRITNMQDVNALVPGQTFTFGPALTAIYGANASGKSGYARVLGCAGFTRGNKEVLPDIMRSSSAGTIPSADIEIFDGSATKVVHFKVDNKFSEFAPFYVFDSTSVVSHLTGSNAFSFSPAGLSYLTKLVDVTDEVREHLRKKIDKYTQPNDFGALFQGESVVAEMISSLGPETKIEELRQLATLTPKEKKRIEDIDTEIARLKTQDISIQINKLKQTIKDIESLTERLLEAERRLCDDGLSDIQKTVEIYLEKETAAQHVSINQFKSDHFTQTGSDTWHEFIRAAKALAEAEQGLDKPYPQHDDRCLLCQQSLTNEARDLLLSTWAFLEGESQVKLEEVEGALKEKYKELDAIDLDFFDDQSVFYRHLQEHDLALLEQVKTYIETYHQRREITLKIIVARAIEAVPPLSDCGITKIEEIIKRLRLQCDTLEEENPTVKISELGQELLSLKHRELLGQHIPQIEDYIKKRIWVQKAARVGGSTRHITKKYKDLFEQLVTERYVQLFEQILKDLRRPLRVKVHTVGRKGITYKQIVLETGSPGSVVGVTPDKVLSEGEKRAVALADFMTEVALDVTSCGIILDDPVTSLDLEWRETIASILAKEAKHRQVILFTHDLPFLYYLKKYTERESVEMVTHWIKRGDIDDKPGYVFLNNSPALERDYRKAVKAREIYQRAKEAPATEQETLLRYGFGALRTTYEAFIIFDLFNEVVMRFDERISFGRLKDVVWDKSISDEVIAKCELLSKYIEGHLHSDAMGAQKPTPDMLLHEVEDFEALRKKHKKLKG